MHIQTADDQEKAGIVNSSWNLGRLKPGSPALEAYDKRMRSDAESYNALEATGPFHETGNLMELERRGQAAGSLWESEHTPGALF